MQNKDKLNSKELISVSAMKSELGKTVKIDSLTTFQECVDWLESNEANSLLFLFDNAEKLEVHNFDKLQKQTDTDENLKLPF